MPKTTDDQSYQSEHAWRKSLLQQLKGQDVLHADELSLFEWYVRENNKIIEQMTAEERAFVLEQIDAGHLDADANNDGRLAIDYYIKRARYANVIYLTSLLEVYLSRASKKLERILGDHNVTFRPDEISGNKWVRHKKFLEGYGKFAFPDDAWATLLTLIDVRNNLVHDNGDATAIKSQDILDRIEKSQGLQADHGEIVIEDAYITHCLSAFQSLVERINSQINQSIGRSLQPQGLKAAQKP